jgi:hypothetical protein
MQSDNDNPKPRRRWFRLTPDHCLFALLVVDCVLPLSDRFGWFPFNEHKGWAVLINMAIVGLASALMFSWFATALLFRWRFRFTIRSLLAMMVVVAIPCSWMAVAMQNAERQRRAVEAISKSGGSVAYDFELEVDRIIARLEGASAKPPEPRRLSELLGNGFFADVDAIYLVGARMTDIGMTCLKPLLQITYVDLRKTDISDAGLTNLDGLSQLETLDFRETRVKGAGLEGLKGLRRLRQLYLGRTPTNDAGLLAVGSLIQLRNLDLQFTKITDVGLEHLKPLSELTNLDIAHTAVTDAGLEHLAGLPKLTKLNLSWTHTSGAAIQKLQRALPSCVVER